MILNVYGKLSLNPGDHQWVHRQMPAAATLQYDAVSYGMLLANEACYGEKRSLLSFRKRESDREPGCRFPGYLVKPIKIQPVCTKQEVTGEKPTLSATIHFENTISLTGSNADDHYTQTIQKQGAVTGDPESIERNRRIFLRQTTE